MKRNTQESIPARLVRASVGVPEIDLEQRTVRAQIVTKLLARDGGIVLPEGINASFFQQNPVVQALHGMADELRSPVIGRSIALAVNAAGMESVTQFADTELGREYAYLYGVNPQKEVFMRAWSFGWRTLSQVWISEGEAKELLGSAWDEQAYAASPFERVWVAQKSEMLEYSAVAVGADRAALSRAYADGNRAAGAAVAQMDFRECSALIELLRDDYANLRDEHARRIRKIEEDLMALRRDGTAAAARGDTAGLLEGLRMLKDMLANPERKKRN